MSLIEKTIACSTTLGSTLVAVPGGLAVVGEELLPALLATSDVLGTGLHGATLAGPGAGLVAPAIGGTASSEASGWVTSTEASRPC